jgi:hypothetical protein
MLYFHNALPLHVFSFSFSTIFYFILFYTHKLPKAIICILGSMFYFQMNLIRTKLDFNRARVSIQEWSRHHSISEVWKAPLRKLSGESNNRPVSGLTNKA